MDRLLQFFAQAIYQRGTFKVTTPRGRTFTCGDGTGKPVWSRFTNRAAELGDFARPRTQVRRSLHGRHADRGARHDCRRAGDPPRTATEVPNWRGHNGCCDTLGGASLNSIPASGRAATSPITMTSTAVSIRSFWMPTGNTAAAISKRRTPRSTMRNSRRNVTLQPS